MVIRLPYTQRLSLLNRSEAAVYLELRRRLPANLHLFAQVRLLDFIDAAEGRHDADAHHWKNRIWRKSVDFLICDFGFRPLMVIEVNGASHRSLERDNFLRQVLNAAQLRLEVIDVGSDFSQGIGRILARLGAGRISTQEQ